MSQIKKAKKYFSEANEIVPADVMWVDGKMIVTKSFMTRFFDVVPRSVTGWSNKGMPGVYKVDTQTVWYDFAKVFAWHTENVASTPGPSRKPNAPVTQLKNTVTSRGVDLSEASPETADIETLERLKKYEDLKKIRLTNAELEGSLIPAEDQDRAMAEQAVIHLVQYQDDFEVLPPALANKSEAFVRSFLDDHYERRIASVHTFITSEYPEPDQFRRELIKLIEGE